jgi:nitrate reductase NapD
MAAKLHISSLVVHGRPECLQSVGAGIAAIAGASLELQDSSGKMVVLAEGGSEQSILDIIAQIESLPGVLATALVFHQVETA